MEQQQQPTEPPVVQPSTQPPQQIYICPTLDLEQLKRLVTRRRCRLTNSLVANLSEVLLNSGLGGQHIGRSLLLTPTQARKRKVVTAYLEPIKHLIREFLDGNGNDVSSDYASARGPIDKKPTIGHRERRKKKVFGSRP
ncbi:MAG: hypothetical protein GY820_31295, partial [Gammaproteobacteria bacterium]|nr:hypothetical protein [Gammaproteobacteria bacterium]